MRSTFQGPAHQLAVRMRIIMAIIAQATSQASNCTCTEGLHFISYCKAYNYIYTYMLSPVLALLERVG